MPINERVIDLTDAAVPASPASVQTYSAQVGCDNCGFSGNTEIPQGIPITTAKCPKCACVTLLRQPESGPQSEPEAAEQYQPSPIMIGGFSIQREQPDNNQPQHPSGPRILPPVASRSPGPITAGHTTPWAQHTRQNGESNYLTPAANPANMPLVPSADSQEFTALDKSPLVNAQTALIRQCRISTIAPSHPPASQKIEPISHKTVLRNQG